MDFNMDDVKTITKLFLKNKNVFGKWTVIPYGENNVYDEITIQQTDNNEMYIQLGWNIYTWYFNTDTQFTDAMIDKIITMADTAQNDENFIYESLCYKISQINDKQICLEFVF